ncbi:MAG TPA: hypothetical protein VEK34_14935 [Methylocella sp.]|nr:hypothetical protein [Methylocella sp.]
MKRIGCLLASAALCVLPFSGLATAEDRGGWHGEIPCCGGWEQAYAGWAFSVAHPWWGIGFPYGYGYYGYPYGYDLAAATAGLPRLVSAAPPVPLATGRSVAIREWGNYCSTPMAACTLHHASLIGGRCSCRVAGGRANGTVSR